MFWKSSTPKPGWYPDNTDPALERRWDGKAWTDQTRVNPGVEKMRKEFAARAARAAYEKAHPTSKPSPAEQRVIDEKQFEYERRPIDRIQYMAFETSSPGSPWHTWMKWTQPQSLPYKRRLEEEGRSAANAAKERADAEADVARLDAIDVTTEKLVAALTDAVMAEAQSGGHASLNGLGSFFLDQDGIVHLHPTGEAGHWTHDGSLLVRVGHLMDADMKREFTRGSLVDHLGKLALTACQRALAELNAARAADAEAVAAGVRAATNACQVAAGVLVAALVRAAAGRPVRKILLAATRSARGVAVVRYADGAEQVITVLEPALVEVLMSDDFELIESWRAHIESRVMGAIGSPADAVSTEPGLLTDLVGGRAVRKVLLAAVGTDRGVADIRYADGTTQVVDVSDPEVLSVLQSGDVDRIESLRCELSAQVGGE